MSNSILDDIAALTGATSVKPSSVLQSLWSGYGEIVRYQLIGSSEYSVVVKHIRTQAAIDHPRGWHTDVGHQRKLRSYQIEVNWYQRWSVQCNDQCRVPKCFGVLNYPSETIIILEDLDQAGFSQRKSNLSLDEVQSCLHWLARFHALFILQHPEGLWPIGSYWQLSTRPDEFAAMAEGDLKKYAVQIDNLLNNATYKTLLHGDAKVANFCFSSENNRVAAVDFQYVGGGCGIRDVAYFLGSCLSAADCERFESVNLDYYFHELVSAIRAKNNAVDVIALEREWRGLFPVAWADFQRFLMGWMPSHKKVNAYSQALTQRVLSELKAAQ